MNNKLYILKTIQVINILLCLAVIGLLAEHATQKTLNKSSTVEKSSKVEKIKS